MKFICAALALLGGLLFGQAHADTVFALTGEFADGSHLLGTLTLDTVAGIATGIDATIDGAHPDHFTLLNDFQVGGPGYYTIFVRDVTNADALELALPSPDGGASLTGFTGGPLYSVSNPWEPFTPLSSVSHQGLPLLTNLSFGELVTVPEPGTLALLASALVCCGLGLRRQRCK